MVIGCLGGLLTLASGWFQLNRSSSRASNERTPGSSLKTLASAQADFHGNDRDGNGIRDFWREDVAGLYATVPVNAPGGGSIKLIELSVAGADASPVAPIRDFTSLAPKAGYLYKAIRHAGEDPAAPHPDRFAFCTWPEPFDADKWMFVIDERNTIFKAPAVAGGVLVFPTDAELKAVWRKLD